MALRQASCKFRNPPGHGWDIRDFRVSGGETCRHARGLVVGVEQGFEGGCGPTCHVRGFTCHEHPGGLTSNASGTGSYYTYSDADCARATKRATWRTCFFPVERGTPCGYARKYGHSRLRSIDLHKVDWADVTLPGSICGASQPIVVHRHHAVVNSTRWPAWPRVTVDAAWDRVVYGDLDGDGEDEAALGVDCNNGGGTADGVLAYARVIFTAAANSPQVIVVVTPQQPQNPSLLPTLVTVRIRPGKIVAHESWYGPSDGTCCPSGRSTTTWTYADGTIRPGGTVVERKPRP